MIFAAASAVAPAAGNAILKFAGKAAVVLSAYVVSEWLVSEACEPVEKTSKRRKTAR